MSFFTVPGKVRFGHTDSAGIIFYPRFFEIQNSVVEDWFDDALDHSFSEFREKFDLTTPLVDVNTQFLKPCRLGEKLDVQLGIIKLGRSSLILRVKAIRNEETCITSRAVLVCSKTDFTGAAPWPDAVRQRMLPYQIEETVS
jgi:4-hydroxybenzoyl-CoA thioesterase